MLRILIGDAAVVRLLLLAATFLLLPRVSPAVPAGEGLVLWLDAHDPDTLTRESGGAVRVWTAIPRQH